jgi:hypothetical protein
MTRTASVLVVALAACSGTEVGNPVVDVDFQIYNVMQVEAATVTVERIRLRPAANCEGDAELELLGPFVVDLLAARPLPELSDLEVAEGGYCRFEVTWDDAAEIGAVSMAFAGARASDGTPFSLQSVRNDELRLDAIDGAFPIDAATHALFVSLDETSLFAGLDLDAAIVDPDGTIYIDDARNTALLDTFEANVEAATKLFDDDDDDRVLDADERDPDDTLAD